MNIYCTACGTPVPTDNINIQQLTAQCARCGNVFRFPAVPANGVRADQGGALTLPKNMTVAQYDTELVISRSWGDWRHILMAVFAGIWLTGTGLFLLMTLVFRAWSAVFFMMLFVAAGV